MIEMTSKFLGVPLKIAGWRPKAGGLLFSPKRYRKVEKNREKAWKNIFYSLQFEKIIFSHGKVLEKIFSNRNL